MKLLTVIPLAKNAGGRPLSYFSSAAVAIGSLVSIPLRNKKVPALVVHIEDVKAKKTELKQASFRLKKISGVIAKPFLSTAFLETVNYLANYYVSDAGSILRQAVPAAVLNKGGAGAIGPRAAGSGYFQPIIMQAPLDERVRYYKSIIRESFAKGESVFVCAPTIQDTEALYRELSQGIAERSFIIHSDLRISAFNLAVRRPFEHQPPILLIGTGMHLFVNRSDLGTIIVDQESSPAYRRLERPFLDLRVFAEQLAKTLKIRVILGDLVPKVETYYAAESSLYQRNIVVSPASTTQTTALFDGGTGTSFSALSLEVTDVMRQIRQRGEKIVLFINRRGLSPITICLDCKQTINCAKCSLPTVVHRQNEGNEFVCHKCLTKMKIDDRCPYCGSWNLKSYGMGAEKVAEEAVRLFADVAVFQLHADIAKNRRQGEKIRDDFLRSEGGILVATELLFSYFPLPLDNIIVVSADNLFTVPDFRISERVFRMLMRLKSITGHFFGIQTRLTDRQIFRDALNGNTASFYRTELETRKNLLYPPFALLIKLTIAGKTLAVLQQEAMTAKNLLHKFDPVDFPSFISKINNLYRYNIILKVRPIDWPHHELLTLLGNLGPRWTVQVDPVNIL